MNKEIFYTVIEENEKGQRIYFSYDPSLLGASRVIIQLGEKKLSVDSQQLGELGELLLALSGGNYDHDSAVELLDGFELSNES